MRAEEHGILALDIATVTGWCRIHGDTYTTGELTLRGPTRGVKAGQFEAWLYEELHTNHVALLAFEEPMFFRGSGGTFLTGLQLIVEKVCEDVQLPYVSVAVPTLKKFATGSGKAKKPEMIAAAEAQLNRTGLSEHEADAYHVARWALLNAEY